MPLDPRYIRLKKLLRKWTEYEIKSRLGQYHFPVYADFFRAKLEMEDKIRDELFGTSSLPALAQQWDMPIEGPLHKSLSDPNPGKKKRRKRIIEKSKKKKVKTKKPSRKKLSVRCKSNDSLW